ncbi:MAG TPA: PaaI family thioesterase [Rhizomicrobium sp.]|nr:PaaI family thioesterase [Rhizomicrobium sp.]
MTAAPEGFTEVRLVDPFELHVGPAFSQGDVGVRRYAFQVQAHHCNLRGVVHGGMLMTLADMTLGQAVWDVTDRAHSVTLNMQHQFIKSAKEGDWIEVVPELTRRTRAFVFMRGDFTANGEIVMTTSSVWKLLGQD